LALFAKYAPRSINATIIGLYYLAFFAANTIVGWIGGFLEKWPTTNFWLLHAALAGAAGLCFVVFKLAVSRRLEVDAG
jgi:POT family proton-dependent oligopeptide transporter